MYAFIEAAIARSRTTMLIMFMVVIAGLISRAVIPVANDPDIDGDMIDKHLCRQRLRFRR